MGTTADKLSYLANTKADIKSAIISKGQPVSDNDTFRSYGDKIRAIQTGITPSGTLYIDENGVYDVTSKAYVDVDVEGSTPIEPDLGTLTVSENGTYYASDDDLDGYDEVVVDVQPGGGPFTVTFVYDPNNTYGPTSQVLQVVNNVPFGGYATFTGTLPTLELQYFCGWNPVPSQIQRNTICFAQYTDHALDVQEISDSWEKICQTRGASYPIGAYKLLPLGTVDGFAYGDIQMQKIASGESGSTSTWLAMHAFATGYRMNATNTTVGGWAESEMRSWLNGTVFDMLPSYMKTAIVPVTKHSRIYDEDGSYYNDDATQDKLWIPSRQEVYDSDAQGVYETEDTYYDNIFPDNTSRIRKRGASGSAISWWLRSVHNAAGFRYVYSGGSEYSNYASNANGVVLGFCL